MPDGMARARTLLATLADGRFHSGQELGQALGVSRAAMWKLVERLRKYGVQIGAVAGRGYRLAQPVELLEPTAIAAAFESSYGRPLPVEVLFRCDSTNHVLLERARAGADAQLLTTEIQHAGRGRWGRRWAAPFGSSLCLSLLWRFPPLPHGLAGLSLAIAIGVAEALTALEAPVRLKWPNDILLGEKKLGGILIEIVGEVEGPCLAVIGIGLNLTGGETIAAQAEQPVATLEQALGVRACARNSLAGQVGAAMASVCERFAAEGFAAFAPRWRQYDAFADMPVVLMLPGEDVRGIARGVDARGGLLLERDGRVETRHSGDLRLRLRRDTAA